MNRNRFVYLQNNGPNFYFDAIEFALGQIRNSRNVDELVMYGTDGHAYTFFINYQRRTAIYTKCVMRQSKYFMFE